jgi:hypothetical protein
VPFEKIESHPTRESTMDQLRALILRFKEYNGSVAANFEILTPYFEDEHNMSDDLTSTFDVMSYHLCKTYIRLSQATVYGTLARQLFVAISEVDRIISDPNHEIADMKMFLKLVRKISTIADKLYKELKKPSCKMPPSLFNFSFFSIHCKNWWTFQKYLYYNFYNFYK